MTTTTTKEDIYTEDRGEDYSTPSVTEIVKLPLTRLGFESLLERVATTYNLPYDDASRIVLFQYIHRIPNTENTTTIEAVGNFLHKAVANSTSYFIGEAIKEHRRKLQAESAATNVTNINQEPQSIA